MSQAGLGRGTAEADLRGGLQPMAGRRWALHHVDEELRDERRNGGTFFSIVYFFSNSDGEPVS
jgi:hypothetical protein